MERGHGASRLLPLARLGVVVNAGLALALVFLWIDQARRGQFYRADFSMLYTGWTMVLHGDGPRLYDLDLQTDYQRRLVPERGSDAGLLPFNYPPPTAFPAAVLAGLPRDTAFYTWAALQLVLLVLLLRWLLEWARGWPAETRALLAATVLGFPALFATFQLGQLSLLALVCLTGLTRALENNRPLPAAGWLVLATLKPQLAVVPAVVLLAGRRWRALVWATLFFLAWASLASAVLGLAAWRDWLAIVRHSAGQFGEYGIFPDRMYSLRGLLAGLLGPRYNGPINTVCLAALGVVALTTVFLWRGSWPGDTDRFRLRWALCVQLGLLVNPHFNPADALVFVLPGTLYCLSAPRDGWFAVVASLLAAGPLIFLIDCYGVGTWPGGVRPFFVAMVVLAAALVWHHEPRTQ